jgi:transcription antitermination factor NusB
MSVGLSGRSLARVLCMQALYQAEMTQATLFEVFAWMDAHSEDESDSEDDASSQRLFKQLLSSKAKSANETFDAKKVKVQRDVDSPLGLDFSLLKAEDKAFARELFREVLEHKSELDEAIDRVATRPVSTMGPVERAILRFSSCEMLFHPQTPYVVVINEAVDVAKAYGPERSHTLINAALDLLSLEYRSVERGL